MLCFVHKCYYNSFATPDVFKDYFHLNNAIHVYGTRFHDRLLHLHTVNSSFGLKCIKFKECLLWNSLPRSLTNINSHAVFKKNLKCYLSESMYSRDCITLTLCGLRGDVNRFCICLLLFYVMHVPVFCFFSFFLCLPI